MESRAKFEVQIGFCLLRKHVRFKSTFLFLRSGLGGQPSSPLFSSIPHERVLFSRHQYPGASFGSRKNFWSKKALPT